MGQDGEWKRTCCHRGAGLSHEELGPSTACGMPQGSNPRRAQVLEQGTSLGQTQSPGRDLAVRHQLSTLLAAET